VKAAPQPWIQSARFDGWLILAPPFAALVVVALLPARLRTGADVPLAAWVALVLLVDVAHVYSTLFRTYLDRQRRRRLTALLVAVPLACWGVGAAVYGATGAGGFWRVLAYAAVWHFVRQQYGFLRLYNRHEPDSPGKQLDEILIYAATLYPLAWWHLAPPRQFSWFVPGDFVQLDWPAGRLALTALYAVLWALYLGKEIRAARRGHPLNWPRTLLLVGTAASWLVGIVWFDADLVFTLLNVVAHGVPYLALVWAGRTTAAPARPSRLRLLSAVLGFLGLIVALAWLEEGLWDGLVWREHAAVFGWFQALPHITHPLVLTWLVPLLAVPQATHYVLDGFIWKRGR
jgi:hypothetical protein